MRPARISAVLLVAALAAAGAITSVALASGTDPGGGTAVPVNELAVALVLLTYLCVAVVITLARPGQLVGRLMLFGAVGWGLGEGALAWGVHDYLPGTASTTDAWLVTLGSASRGLGWLVLILAVPLVFPDGRLAWPDRRLPTIVATAAIGTFTLATLLSPTPLENRAAGMDSPTGLPERYAIVVDVLAVSALGVSVVALAIAIAGLVHRWRKGDELERQQLLWFSAAFAMPLLFLPLIATPAAAPWMFALVTIPVPVAVAVALFQRRLYDVQLVVSRTLTYVLLSAAVAGLYATTVGGVGALLQERGAPWLAWVAAGVVAVTFAPLRNTLQQAVNRLTYGQWSQPADVLAATGRRLADASDVPALLQTLTQELGAGLGLDHVEIRDAGGHRLAARGRQAQQYDELRLTAYGASVGALRWNRTRLRAADRELLEDVAHQLGGVVHAAGLLDTIREAQERLVLAREEERRRLRRDLHDGLGPALAGLTLQVDTLRNRLSGQRRAHLDRRPGGWPGGLSDDRSADCQGERLDDRQAERLHDEPRNPRLDVDAELLDLRSGIQQTVLDVRRIVEGLRPPALDELGLETAIRQLVARLTTGSALVVDIDVPPLPALPAAVEVALYRVAQEALTNIVRHSGAGRVHLTVTLQATGISLDVTDDGNGQAQPTSAGVGLSSMRERAGEISGTLAVDGRPRRATSVRLWLPLAGHLPADLGERETHLDEPGAHLDEHEAHLGEHEAHLDERRAHLGEGRVVVP